MVGDPSKPDMHVVLSKWKAHHNSKPHSHPNDGFITVISGTCWVGAGTDYAPAHLKLVPADSFASHYGNEVHYDGAKDEDTSLQSSALGRPHRSKQSSQKILEKSVNCKLGC